MRALSPSESSRWVVERVSPETLKTLNPKPYWGAVRHRGFQGFYKHVHAETSARVFCKGIGGLRIGVVGSDFMLYVNGTFRKLGYLILGSP